MRKTGCMLLTVCAAALGAEPTLLRYAPTGTGVLIGIDVIQLRNTDIGRSAMAQMQAQRPGVKLPEFDEILLALPPESNKGRGLILLRGPCNPAEFLGWAQRGPNRPGNEVAVECVSPNVLAMGDPETVKRAIRDPAGADPVLVARAHEIAAANDVWLVTGEALASLAGDLPFSGPAQAGIAGDLMKSVRQVSLGVKFGPTLVLAADLGTRDANDASALASALRLLTGLAAQQGAAGFSPILQKLQIRPESSSVKLSLAVAQDELQRAFKSAVEGFAQQARKAQPVKPPDTGIIVYSSPTDMGTVKLDPAKPR